MRLPVAHNLLLLAALVGLIGEVAFRAPALAAPPKKTVPVDPDEDDPPPAKKKRPPVEDEEDEPPVKKKTARSPLEALIKENGWKYERGDGDLTMFKISVPSRGKTLTLFAIETTIGTSKNGDPVVVGIVGMPVHTFPQGERPTSQVYKAVAELNDVIALGRVSATRSGVLFTSSFILRDADGIMLNDHVSVVIGTQVDVKKRLTPYLTEEESE